MGIRHIPEDDIIDIMEMSEKIERAIYNILDDLDIEVAMSTLMGAMINCMIAQCESIDELIFYRNSLVNILDDIILARTPKQE